MIQDSVIPSPAAQKMPRRMALVGLALLLCFSGILVRLHWLQCTRHDAVTQRVAELHRQKRVLAAHRGSIMDRNRDLLANDKTTWEIFVSSLQLRDLTTVRRRLAELENVTPRELGKSATTEQIFARYHEHVVKKLAAMLTPEDGNREQWLASLRADLEDSSRAEFRIAKDLRDDEADDWKSFIEENNLLGIQTRAVARRAYPCNDRLTNVIGYVDHMNEGIAGIEASFETTLAGKDGYQWIERDRKGREATTFRGDTVEPRNGRNVVLTIDLHLQEILEDVIESANAVYRPRRIMAVLVEPKTGAIRAMASRPDLNRSNMTGGFLNHATADTYEPGSIFKIVGYTGVFDRGLFGLSDTIDCEGDQKFMRGITLQEHVGGHPSVLLAFAKSSNRAAAVLTHRLGEDSFIDYVHRFGFGVPTGVPLSDEAAGTVKVRHLWSNLTFSRMSIGQEVTVTALQMAMATSAIANGGVLMKPLLVQDIRDDQGNIVQAFAPQTVRRVCSEHAASLMRQAMEAVTGEKGTGTKAAIHDIRIAGKTGTAQLYKDHGIWDGHYCVSFTGFAPADNPELCAVVTVDNPTSTGAGRIEGGTVAAPIFADLMSQCLEQVATTKTAVPVRKALAEGGRK